MLLLKPIQVSAAVINVRVDTQSREAITLRTDKLQIVLVQCKRNITNMKNKSVKNFKYIVAYKSIW